MFKRKLGFDHTEVTILLNGQPMKIEARPYIYFYLKDKKQLDIKIGHSEMGEFVTHIRSTFVEKTVARWDHLKDMVYRQRWLVGIIILIIVASVIKTTYFPDQPGHEKKQISFWKLLGLIMAILLAIALLLYAGLWIYVSFLH